MERELWPRTYALLRRVGDDFSRKYAQYPPWVIAAVLLWAAAHAPLCRACDPANWSTTGHRPGRLPSRPGGCSAGVAGFAAGVGEAPVGQRLVRAAGGGGYLLADGNYDSNALFDDATAAGYQLVVPAWRPGAGTGHRRQSPHRLRSIHPAGTAYGRSLYRLRTRIERSFGHAGGFGGGFGPLPSWVRTAHRVYCWVAAKFVLNGVRIVRKQGLTPQMQNVVRPGLKSTTPVG